MEGASVVMLLSKILSHPFSYEFYSLDILKQKRGKQKLYSLAVIQSRKLRGSEIPKIGEMSVLALYLCKENPANREFL